jgi:hypothetical protein
VALQWELVIPIYMLTVCLLLRAVPGCRNGVQTLLDLVGGVGGVEQGWVGGGGGGWGKGGWGGWVGVKGWGG